MSHSPSQPRVIVIGGGLAGIAAALDCAKAGAQVQLLEVRPRLGGAAYSFQRQGLELDNGQHVFMRCCSAYRALLAELGSEHLVRIQPRLHVPILAPGGLQAEISRTDLHPPAHMAGALMRFPLLSRSERLRAGFAGIALARIQPSDPASDRQNFGTWLAAHGQSDSAIRDFWDLMVLPTLNVPAAEASLALAAFVLKTIMFSDAGAGDIGFHEAPLSQILGEPALALLHECGVQVLLGTRALDLAGGSSGMRVQIGAAAHGTQAIRQELQADSVIVALPHQRAAALLRAGLPDLNCDDAIAAELAALAGRLESLQSSPIINLHVLYDRKVCELPFFAAARSPLQYVFDRSAAGLCADAAHTAAGQYLAVSLSAAERQMAMSRQQLRSDYLLALHELLPQARPERVLDFHVSREHAATFRATPGSARLRPAANTALPGLLLAGAYTDTGWPATLEGAVRSGHAAAAGALAQLGLVSVPAVNGNSNARAVPAGAPVIQVPIDADSSLRAGAGS